MCVHLHVFIPPCARVFVHVHVSICLSMCTHPCVSVCVCSAGGSQISFIDVLDFLQHYGALDDITHPNIKTSCASQPSPAAFSSRLTVPKAEAVAQPGVNGMLRVASGSSRAAPAIPAQSSP